MIVWKKADYIREREREGGRGCRMLLYRSSISFDVGLIRQKRIYKDSFSDERKAGRPLLFRLDDKETNKKRRSSFDRLQVLWEKEREWAWAISVASTHSLQAHQTACLNTRLFQQWRAVIQVGWLVVAVASMNRPFASKSKQFEPETSCPSSS